MPKKTPKEPPAPLSYNQTVYEMMAYYPSLYPTELKAQQSLFLTTSGSMVDSEGNLSLDRGWSPKERHQGRSKESILGEETETEWSVAKQDRVRKPSKNWQRFEAGEDCMFYPLGNDGMNLWTAGWSEGTEFYKGDIFNSILKGTFKMLPGWEQPIGMFCYHVAHEDELAYKAILFGYVRKNYRGSQLLHEHVLPLLGGLHEAARCGRSSEGAPLPDPARITRTQARLRQGGA